MMFEALISRIAKELDRAGLPYIIIGGQAPLEIISKVILRHPNLSTTQRYLGKVSEPEAMRWIESLYG